MKIDKRFEEAIEGGPRVVPDYGSVVFSVCAVDPGACGWSGWVFGALFHVAPSKGHPTKTGDELVEADYTQRCPGCGRTLFRTAYARRISVSPDPLYPELESKPADDIQYE